MFCTANDHQGNFARLSFDADAEMMKLIVENFARALPPISQDAQASLEFEIDGVGDAAVGASAGNAEEVPRFFGLFERRSEAQRDIADFTAGELFRGFGYVPGKFEFLCEDVCGASGQQCKRDALTILRSGKAVDNFVDGTVTAASNDELTAISAGAPCDFDRFARSGCFREVRPDAAQTLSYFRQQGISVKILSGDDHRTVTAVAREVGIDVGEGYDARSLTSTRSGGVRRPRTRPTHDRILSPYQVGSTSHQKKP